MKYAIITLIAIALLAAGCGQTRQKQTETSPFDDNIPDVEEYDDGVDVVDIVFKDFDASERFLVTETEWKGVKYDSHHEAADADITQIFTFPKANMRQVYHIMKKINPNLLPELPEKNVKGRDYNRYIDKYIEINYEYIQENHLSINLRYNGGMTEFIIYEKENETTAYIRYFIYEYDDEEYDESDSDFYDYLAVFVDETEWEGMSCRYNNFDNADWQTCSYPKANMRQVYNIVRKIDTNLKPEMPAGDLDYMIDNVIVKYSYESRQFLTIMLDYSIYVKLIRIYKYDDSNDVESDIVYRSKDEGCIRLYQDENLNTGYKFDKMYDSDRCDMDAFWKDATCRWYGFDDTFTVFCITLPDANMQQAYDMVKKINPRFKSELPARNAKFSLPKDETLEYRYNTKNHLTIHLKYNSEDPDDSDDKEIRIIDIIEKEDETILKVLLTKEDYGL